MSDVFTEAKRSEVMSRIFVGTGNKDTEVALLKLLRRHHITAGVAVAPSSANPISSPN